MMKSAVQARQNVSNDDEERADLRVLRALRRIIRAIDIHSRRLANAHRITTPQLVSLLFVVENGPVTTSAIGRSVHLSNSTVVGILDRLEAKGLVTRTRSREDRREVYVEATPEGVSVAKVAPSPLQGMLLDSLATLPVDEQNTIAQSLERIVELMEARNVSDEPILDVNPIDHPTEADPDEE